MDLTWFGLVWTVPYSKLTELNLLSGKLLGFELYTGDIVTSSVPIVILLCFNRCE